MNSSDLLDLIGETPEKYVLDTLEHKEAPQSGKRRSVSRILLIAALISLLSATAATAADFWINVDYQDSFTNAPTEPIPADDSVPTDDTVITRNGVIEFYVDIEEEIYGELIPSLEVKPHFLTEEDVKRVAYILFPEGEFYEGEAALEKKLLQRRNPGENGSLVLLYFGRSAAGTDSIPVLSTGLSAGNCCECAEFYR